MTSTPVNSPDDQRTDDGVPVPSGQSDETLHVVDTVEVVETNQPMDAWGED
jgi:hypothetical protein